MKPTLNQAADGRIGPIKRFLMFLHLLHCPGCRRFLRNLQELVANIRQRREREVEPDAMERLAKVVKSAGRGDSSE